MLRRPWRLLCAVVVVLLVAFVVYAAWLLLTTERALTRASADGHALKTAIGAGDAAGVTSAVSSLQRDAGSAKDHTDGPVWWLLEHVPFVGDDARGVRTVSQVAADLSDSNLAQLATQTGDLTKILPSGGRVDLGLLKRLAPTVAQGHEAVASAARRLDAQDSSGFVSQLRTKYVDLQSQVDDADSALGMADRALQVMPSMLGASGPKHFLLVLQNNAEIRASGGLPGAVSELEADHGSVRMVKQTSGSAFPRTESDILPLSSTEAGLYGRQLGQYFLDANFTPDFPRAADLWRARWRKDDGGDIDGVISVDPVALSYLLKATGPITAGGVQLTSDNVVDELLHNSYVRIPDPAAQDAFFRAVAKTVFDRITGGVPNPRDVVSALRQGAAEHRILVHSFDAAVQKHLSGTAVAGELLPKVGDHPQVGVYFNDSTGAKMSYYLRYQADVGASYCTSGVQGLTGHLTIGSQAPADAGSLPPYVTGAGVYGVKPGDQVVTVMLFGPEGGSLDQVQVDGAPTRQATFNLDGRPVTKLWVTLPPGKSDQVTWTMKSGAGQTGDTLFSMTPSIVPGSSSATVPSAC